jgi:hemoglobin
MKTDIRHSEDIKKLVDTFYEQIKTHPRLGPIFVDFAQVDWGHHLPKMYAFWDMILFEKPGYQGTPLRPHLALNASYGLNADLFADWIDLFSQTIDTLFEGEKAQEAKQRAANVAMSWAHKITYLNAQNSAETPTVS